MKQLSRLWQFVRRYRWRLAAGIALGVLSAVLNFVSLPTIRKVFEVLFEGKQADALRGVADSRWLSPFHGLAQWLLGLNPLGALMVIAGALTVIKGLQVLCKGLQEYYTGYVASHSAVDVANALYRNVIDLPVGFFTQARNSQVISRFTNDLGNIERGLDTVYGKMLIEPFYLAGCLLYCWLLSPTLTIASLLVVPFVGVGAWLLARKAKRAAQRGLQSRSRLLGFLTESLAGIRIVKVFQGADYEKARFDGENGRLFRQNLKIVKAEAATGALVEFFLFLGVAVVITVAGYSVLYVDMKPSDVIVFMVALAMAMDPLRKLSSVNTRVQTTVASAERLFEYMDLEPEPTSAPGAADVPPVRRSIRFEKVSFRYDHHPVLVDVDFEVKQGEVVAIVGASGAGKTTLVNLLARFYAPTSGRILFDSVDIASCGLVSLRRQIGLVTQEVLLFDDTVRSNIAYGAERPDERRVMAAAKAAHVEEFVARLPQGLDTVIGEGGSMLSGGQRQRIALARAIYKDPAVLVLDEATSSLDSESEHLIKEALDEFMRGRTTFVIAHRLATVERADRIIVLEHGRIESIGSHAELVAHSDIYRGLYQRQFRSVLDEDAENGTDN